MVQVRRGTRAQPSSPVAADRVHWPRSAATPRPAALACLPFLVGENQKRNGSRDKRHTRHAAGIREQDLVVCCVVVSSFAEPLRRRGACTCLDTGFNCVHSCNPTVSARRPVTALPQIFLAKIG